MPSQTERKGGPPARRTGRPGTAPPRPKPKTSPTERLSVEIVCLGGDLLRGRIAPTNAQEIATFLSQRGAVVGRITIVDDSDRAVADAVREGLARGSRLVVTVGGLGPMTDDRTLAAVSDALQLPLAPSVHAREIVESAYRRLHRAGLVTRNGMTAAREKMCSLPIGGEPVPNSAGVAPGVVTRLAGGTGVLCLPGTPAEMRAVLEAAIPHLRDLAPKGVVARREVETPTRDESSLRPLLDRLAGEFPTLWIRSHPPGFGADDARIRVLLEAGAGDKQEAEALVEDAVRRLIALAAGG